MDVRFDRLKNIKTQGLLPLANLLKGPAAVVFKNRIQKSGISVPEPAAEDLKRQWAEYLQGLGRSSPGDNLGSESTTLNEASVETGLPEDDMEPPGAVQYTTTRRVRNTAKGDQLKRLYSFKCQVCAYAIRVPREGIGNYAEVHHFKPLGGDHKGLDNWNNMLVLCPNCHAEFDGLALAIEPKSFRITALDKENPKHHKKVRFLPPHELAPANIKYHLRRFKQAGEEVSERSE